jgi:hypothetical protein
MYEFTNPIITDMFFVFLYCPTKQQKQNIKLENIKKGVQSCQRFNV